MNAVTLSALADFPEQLERHYAAVPAEFKHWAPPRFISGLSPEQLTRAAVFEGYGRLSLRSLVHYLCSHDQQHLAGLQWLLGKIEAHRVRADG